MYTKDYCNCVAACSCKTNYSTNQFVVMYYLFIILVVECPMGKCCNCVAACLCKVPISLWSYACIICL